MVKLAARGMHRTGMLRLIQHFSQRREIAQKRRGLIPALQQVRSPKFAILCYHRVGTAGVPFHSGFEKQAFEEQIRFLRNAYRIVTMDELCRELDENRGPTQAVAITFDDGYRDVYTNAFPILRKYGVPATVYLTAAAIETGEVAWYDRIFALAMQREADTLRLDGNPSRNLKLTSVESRLRAATEIVRALRGYANQDRIAACAALESQIELPKNEMQDRMLTWRQIREMQEWGVAFGAHTMHHPAVASLAPSERQHELMDSRKLLEARLQKPVVHFAFPFGLPSDIGVDACALMRDYGYQSAVSTVWGVNTPSTNRYLLRRIGGEEPSLPLLALRLRWLFLKEQAVPAEMQDLESALQHKSEMKESRLEKYFPATELERA